MSAPNSSASPSFIPSLQGGSYSNASSPLVNVQSIAQGFNGQPQFLKQGPAQSPQILSNSQPKGASFQVSASNQHSASFQNAAPFQTSASNKHGASFQNASFQNASFQNVPFQGGFYQSSQTQTYQPSSQFANRNASFSGPVIQGASFQGSPSQILTSQPPIIQGGAQIFASQSPIIQGGALSNSVYLSTSNQPLPTYQQGKSFINQGPPPSAPLSNHSLAPSNVLPSSGSIRSGVQEVIQGGVIQGGVVQGGSIRSGVQEVIQGGVIQGGVVQGMVQTGGLEYIQVPQERTEYIQVPIKKIDYILEPVVKKEEVTIDWQAILKEKEDLIVILKTKIEFLELALRKKDEEADQHKEHQKRHGQKKDEQANLAIEELTKNLETLQRKLDEASQQIVILSSENENLKLELSQKLALIQKYEININEYTIQISQGDQNLRDYENKIALLSSELSRLKHKSQQAEKEKTSFLDEIKDYQERIALLSTELTRLKETQSSISSSSTILITEKRELEDKIGSLTFEISSLRNEISRKSSDYDRINLMYVSITNEYHEFRVRYTELESSKSDLERLLSIKTTEYESLQITYNTLKIDVDRLKNTLFEYENKIALLSGENTRLNSMISKNKERSSVLEVSTSQLQIKLAQQENTINELNQRIVDHQLSFVLVCAELEAVRTKTNTGSAVVRTEESNDFEVVKRASPTRFSAVLDSEVKKEIQFSPSRASFNEFQSGYSKGGVSEYEVHTSVVRGVEEIRTSGLGMSRSSVREY